MEYQLASITWEHKGILSSEHIELDNWSMNNFVNGYLNSFEWWEFGFFYIDDIKAEIEENKGDEDYSPIIPLLEFEKYNTSSLVYNSGEIFPEETSWRNFDSFVSYLRSLGMDIVDVLQYNNYEIVGGNKFKCATLTDSDYNLYNFIGDVISELNAENTLLDELEAIQYSDDIKTEEDYLYDVSTVLNRYGYTIKQL